MKRWDYENEQWMKLPPYLKHLPLFTQHIDWTGQIFRLMWAFFLKWVGYRFYIRIKVIGDFKKIAKEHPRLLLISNHASHLDATSVAAAIPYRYWSFLYITAAKDYFFSNWLFTYFSKHCLGAIPIDRKDKKKEAVKLCLSLLSQLDRIWMILFPEGTRSPDGKIQAFRKGISLFSQETNTPILFMYVKGNSELWPKGRSLPLPGKLEIHLGPVHPPANNIELHASYKQWVLSIDPEAEFSEASGKIKEDSKAGTSTD